MQLKPGAHLYFVGIGGTGMASVAALCQAAGYRVTGSDAGVYPPMSTMLADLGIPVKTPYAEANLDGVAPDLCVIANVLSRGNVELETVLSRGLPYASFPQLLGENFLDQRVSIVVAGTHGKTTTTSLMAHVLNELGEDPSFLVGGIPRNFPHSIRLGKSPLFAIEGDEYDTAYFDKGPKFLHYRPKHLILNNLEFDHADIYPNVEAIEAQFERLIRLVEDPSCIVMNADDMGIARVVSRLGLEKRVTRVATLGHAHDCLVTVRSASGKPDGGGGQTWSARIAAGRLGEIGIETALSGAHNVANIAQVVACLLTLEQRERLRHPLDAKKIAAAFASFLPPARRLELLASVGGIDVYEDFAHHPTAVRLVIEGFRAAYPKKRLVVAFEPRSATNRRNVFQKDYVRSLTLADRVLIGECMLDKRIPEDQRFDPAKLTADIGSKASAFPTNDALLSSLSAEIAPGDAVIFMSSGSFSGAQYKLAKALRDGTAGKRA
jgi:UDP-N-acetylmuramate: L-alanyl-gamma-D-glutamyl-meso-diaminopimelate ligase